MDYRTLRSLLQTSHNDTQKIEILQIVDHCIGSDITLSQFGELLKLFSYNDSQIISFEILIKKVCFDGSIEIATINSILKVLVFEKTRYDVFKYFFQMLTSLNGKELCVTLKYFCHEYYRLDLLELALPKLILTNDDIFLILEMFITKNDVFLQLKHLISHNMCKEQIVRLVGIFDDDKDKLKILFDNFQESLSSDDMCEIISDFSSIYTYDKNCEFCNIPDEIKTKYKPKIKELRIPGEPLYIIEFFRETFVDMINGM